MRTNDIPASKGHIMSIRKFAGAIHGRDSVAATGATAVARRQSALSSLTACIAVVAATLLFVSSAWAGEFFEKNGAALRGFDPVAYFKDGKPVKGLPEHKAEYKGSTFLFSTQINRGDFVADPAKYAPQYGGYCAFGAAGGYKAATDPAAFTVIDGKLYLNYNGEVQKQWRADVPGFVTKADKNWPTVSPQTKVFE
jgi:YHS domain-containing protein